MVAPQHSLRRFRVSSTQIRHCRTSFWDQEGLMYGWTGATPWVPHDSLARVRPRAGLDGVIVGFPRPIPHPRIVLISPVVALRSEDTLELSVPGPRWIQGQERPVGNVRMTRLTTREETEPPLSMNPSQKLSISSVEHIKSPPKDEGLRHSGTDDPGQDEISRLELMHSVLSRVFDDRLIFPPVGSPRRILDCGSGAGDWAVDVAGRFPDCEVRVATSLPRHEQPSRVSTTTSTAGKRKLAEMDAYYVRARGDGTESRQLLEARLIAYGRGAKNIQSERLSASTFPGSIHTHNPACPCLVPLTSTPRCWG
ncbi:Uncharacterized protein TCAP_06929 [Tolypocladium capitatum]|uniref:Methyltransferase domain-containing protein n=1 Tax=Tolypocladium capitatum TaxID=45235 RepID=A0A2K3Q6B6_9HYPO|nr:Uncharacterized protein TCAP_06929 [Tolypocladium capitatum]